MSFDEAARLLETDFPIVPDNPAELITFGLFDPLDSERSPSGVAGILQSREELTQRIKSVLATLNEDFTDEHGRIYGVFPVSELSDKQFDSLIVGEPDKRVWQIAEWITRFRHQEWLDRCKNGFPQSPQPGELDNASGEA